MLNTIMRLAVVLALGATCLAADDGLVAHYTFEEGPGGVVKDTSGNANDGKIVGNVEYVKLENDKGYAMRFNAGNSYVDCGNNPSLDVKDAVTIAVWFRPETNPYGIEAGLVSNGSALGSYALTYVPGTCWWYVVGGDQPRLNLGSNGIRADSTWHHVAVTFDGKESRFYIDGNLDATIAMDKRAKINAGGPLYLRYPIVYGSSKERSFVCMLDDVRIYNRALSQAELVERYKQDRNWRKGREVVAGQLGVTTRLYTKLSKLRVEVDFAGLGTLPEGTTLTAELIDAKLGTVVDKQHTDKLPISDKWLAVFNTSKTPAGDYVVRTTASNRSAKPLASVSKVQVTIPQPAPASPDIEDAGKPLNNLVIELLDVQAPPWTDHREYWITNPRKGWIFISSNATVQDGGQVRITIESDGKQETVITHKPGQPPAVEAMRYLSAGTHTLTVDTESSRQNSINVRAIPELLYAEIGYNPTSFMPAFGPYTWEYIDSIGLLDNLNVILERHPTDESYAKRWRQQGKKILTYGNTHAVQSGTAEGTYQYWSQLDGFQRPDRDGVMFDELGGNSNISAFPGLSGGVRKLADNPSFGDKVLYPYCGLLHASEPSTTFCWEIVEAGYKLADEKYLQEQPTLEAAQSYLATTLTEAMSKYEQAIPNWQEHMIMVLGYMSAPPETLNTIPSVDYKVFLDMQFNILANDPAFKGLYGVMCYHSAYADEEIMRWTAKLYRHYCIEGKRELLSKDPYVLSHLKNPDFEDGSKGWTLTPAEAGGIDARNVSGYSYVQTRYPLTTHGDTVLWTKRSASGPNRFSQQVKGLTPGRLYSLKMFTADYQRFVTGKGVPGFEAVDVKGAVAIKLDGVDLVADKSFRVSFASGRAGHSGKGFNRDNNLPITYDFIVFRAKRATAMLTISDWADATTPGGPIGQELMFNFIELQPYLED
jgi:hypothetical protein